MKTLRVCPAVAQERALRRTGHTDNGTVELGSGAVPSSIPPQPDISVRLSGAAQGRGWPGEESVGEQAQSLNIQEEEATVAVLDH